MPEKRTIERAKKDNRQGKAPTTQAGEFIREEVHHIRESKHGARSAKQAIAIGLSKARRSGVKLPPPAPGKTSERTRKNAERAYEVGQHHRPTTHRPKVSRAIEEVMKREPHRAASHQALSKQAHSAASKRTHAQRSAAAKKASRTKGPTERRAAAQKAARTRAREHGR